MSSLSTEAYGLCYLFPIPYAWGKRLFKLNGTIGKGSRNSLCLTSSLAIANETIGGRCELAFRRSEAALRNVDWTAVVVSDGEKQKKHPLHSIHSDALLFLVKLTEHTYRISGVEAGVTYCPFIAILKDIDVT